VICKLAAVLAFSPKCCYFVYSPPSLLCQLLHLDNAVLPVVSLSMTDLPSTVTLVTYRPDLSCTMCIISRTLRSSPLSWLPVLANIEPPALRCKAAVDNLIEKTNLLAEWPLRNYVFFRPQNCLPPCRPLWTNIYSTDIISRWRHEWK